MTLDQFLEEWNNGAELLLVHTSGSTGQPKPLWVEKRRMEVSARITCDFLGLKEGDPALLCLPLDYIAGKMMAVRSLVAGLRLVDVPPSGHPLSSLPLAALREPLAFAAMVPMQVYNSLQVAEECERLRQIRHLIIGGGAIDEALAEQLRSFPNAVWSTYGMTETLSHIALRRLSGPQATDWYTPLPTVQVELSEEGCLIVYAPQVCEHRLVTNDIAELEVSPAGRPVFRILGRKDNVIVSGGVKIQAEEVERMLKPFMRVPFMITKRKDEKLGEAVVMLLEGTGREQAEEERLRMLCRQHLPRFWQPRHYVSVPRLPMTETGKPARRRAEELVRDCMRRQ